MFEIVDKKLYNIDMHPLSIFPELLNFPLVAPALLRLVVGFFILYVGWARYKKPYSWLVIFNTIAGIMILLGLYTQATVIAAVILLKIDFLIDKKVAPANTERYILYILAICVLLSFLVTGPGLFALDLPL